MRARRGVGRGGQGRGRIPVGLLAFVVVCRLLVVGDGLGRHRTEEGTEVPMQPLSPVGLDPPGIQPKPFMHALPCPFPFPGAQTPEDMTDGRIMVPRDWLLQPGRDRLPLTFSMSTSSVS